MDLLSLVLSLAPLQAPPPDAALPLWWGRAAHALLLNTVRRYDERLAESLHNDQGPRPFTASSLLGRFPAGNLDPARSYTLRFTAFQGELVAILMKAAQTDGPLAPGAQIELDYLPFRILAVQPSNLISDGEFPIAKFPIPNSQSEFPNPQSSSPNPQSAIRNSQSVWSALTSYQELSAPYLLAKLTPPRRITFQFASPTSFKSGGMHIPLPLPELVFNSLLERWNAYAPVLFPPETRRYAAECLALSRYRLSSRSIPVKSLGMRVGGVGEATYISLNYDRYWMSLISVLARFAMFSGVGAGASMGLGQCRLKEEGVSPPAAEES